MAPSEVTPTAELITATWAGPFTAQTDQGIELSPGDEYEITPLQALGGHWLVNGEPFQRDDVHPVGGESNPIVAATGAGDVVDVTTKDLTLAEQQAAEEAAEAERLAALERGPATPEQEESA